MFEATDTNQWYWQVELDCPVNIPNTFVAPGIWTSVVFQQVDQQ
jgi:hypothetical protein